VENNMLKYVRAIYSAKIMSMRIVDAKKTCPVCNGSGMVISGYGVVCTELVEKFERCPECNGKGFLKPNGSLEE
jgi:DnaJ-class molecular chaperone